MVVCPAQTVGIDAGTGAVLTAGCRAACRCKSTRIPVVVYTGLGVVCGIKGAPRCPVAAARAITAFAGGRKDLWGPRGARDEAGVWWSRALEWARRPLSDNELELAEGRHERDRRLLREAGVRAVIEGLWGAHSTGHCG